MNTAFDCEYRIKNVHIGVILWLQKNRNISQLQTSRLFFFKKKSTDTIFSLYNMKIYKLEFQFFECAEISFLLLIAILPFT